MSAYPRLPVWTALSSGNLEQVVLPTKVTRVVVLADNDDGAVAGLGAARCAAERLHAEGRRVWIAHPASVGDDFNLLLAEGPDAVRTVVERAAEWQSEPAPAEPTRDGGPTIGTHRPLGFGGATSALPQLRADDGDLARLTDRIWNLLLDANTPPWLYRCGGGPAWIERDDDVRPVPHSITEDRLRHVLAQLVSWRKLRVVAEGPDVAPVDLVGGRS